MPKLPNDLPECLVFLLGKAYQKAHGKFKKRIFPYGLTNIQHLVLEALWYSPGISATDLSKILILDRATLSGVIDRMVEGGWIIKENDQLDRRLYKLYPSKKANELKDKLIIEREKANEELLVGFSEQEKVLFKRLLKDFIEKD
ncbi:MarR family winged helix-turn-helix transcriptional regulator [Desulfothermus sp.]